MMPGEVQQATWCKLGQLVSQIFLSAAACLESKDGQPGQHCPQAILLPETSQQVVGLDAVSRNSV